MTEVDLKKKLVESWKILKDENMRKPSRADAYGNIVKLTNEIMKTDKSFSLNQKALDVYKEFEPLGVEKLDRQVQWPSGRGLTDLKKDYNNYVTTAVEIVTERHPKLDTDLDKFGTIVNATVSNLIALASK